MNKKGLIEEILADKEDSFTIFSKGYLNHFDLDQETFSLLLPKLVKEADNLQKTADMMLVSPDTVSNQVALEFESKADKFYKLVYNACQDEVIHLPYCIQSSIVLAKVLNTKLVGKINAKAEEGFKFSQESKLGILSILNPQGKEVFSSPFVSARSILKEFGINVEHPHYSLFYFGLFPKEELEQYRIAYCFNKHFKLI